MPSSWEEPKQSSSGGSPFGWLLVLVAVFVIGSYVGPIDWKWSSAPDDDKKEQVEPAPKPAKLEKGSHVIVVEETELRKNFPFVAAIESDRDYWDKLKADGINWRFYDSQDDAVQSYKDDFTSAGLPALLVISPAGRVLFSKSLPPTTDSIDEALRSMK
jgi:hypothetical protein